MYIYIYHRPPKPTCLEVFMVNNLVFRWPKPLFFMVSGAHGIYIYMLPPPQDLCFDIAVRQIRHTQQKHVRAIFSVENIAVMVRHRQELYLSRDG